MVIKKTLGEKIFDCCNVILLILLMIVTLYPLLYIAFSSVSLPYRLISHTGLLLHPLGFTLEGYRMVLNNTNVLNGFKNTIIYVGVGTAINLVFTSLAAYVLSRRHFAFNKFLMRMIVFTMFFSGGLIPTYLVVSGLGMRNTLWALTVPVAIRTWNLIIMRTSFMSVPDSFEESAKIDGASEITILLRIILPLSKAILAVMTLFYGVAHWNSWFRAAIYLSDRAKYPLQLFLREILIINNTQEMTAEVSSVEKAAIDLIIQYATIMVATVPILMLYPFLQKYFTKGVMIGGIKG